MTRVAQFALLAVLFFAADRTNACSCLYQDPNSPDVVREALDRADVVFAGTAETVEVLADPEVDYGAEYQTTTFLVKNSWKGEKANRIITKVNIQCCICGFSFEQDQTYLVFGYETDEGFYSVSICGLSRTYAEAGDIVRILDEIISEGESK